MAVLHPFPLIMLQPAVLSKHRCLAGMACMAKLLCMLPPAVKFDLHARRYINH
jgi:hypothetical protein